MLPLFKYKVEGQDEQCVISVAMCEADGDFPVLS